MAQKPGEWSLWYNDNANGYEWPYYDDDDAESEDWTAVYRDLHYDEHMGLSDVIETIYTMLTKMADCHRRGPDE